VLGLKLGRVRDGVEWDQRFPFGLSDFSTADIVRSWRNYRVAMKRLDGDQVQITFTAPPPQRSRFQLEIDTRRKVVLRSRNFDRDYRVNSVMTFSDFVEVAGVWWAGKIEQHDKKNRLIHRQTLTVKASAKDAAVAAMTKTAAAHSEVLFIGAIDPKLEDAKQAVHENKAGFAEHMRVALHYAATQQWEKVWGNMDRAARAAEEFKAGLPALVETIKTATANAKDFLAAHVRQLGTSVLGANEQLALLEDLLSVYAVAGEDAAWRDLLFRTAKAQLLWNLGRQEEALRLRKATARKYANHMRAVSDYLRTLVSTADLDGAVQYAGEVLRREDRWLESEIDSVFYQWTDGLWSLRRLPQLLQVAKRWHDRRAENQEPYVRYVSALLFNNKEGDADKWVSEHLADERTKISRAYQQELGAAIRLALGSGWNFNANGIDKKWLAPLAKLARRLARTEGDMLSMVQNIVGNWRFRQTDQYRELRKWFLQDLMADGVIAEMSLERLGYYLRWISWHKDHVAVADWQKVTSRIRSRFDSTKDKDEQHQLGTHVLMLLDVRQEKKPALAFLRDWMKVALHQKDHVVRILFERLAREDWTKEGQAELFALIPALQPEKAEDHQRQAVAAGAARLLADSLMKTKVKALLGPVEKLEKLPRAERREKTKVSRAQARKDLAAAFANALEGTDKWARPWLTLEQLCFAAETKKGLAEVADATRKLLASIPKVDPDKHPQEARMPWVLRSRCTVLLAYAASRRDTPAGVADGVLKVYRDGEKADKGQKLLNWRYQSFRLLVALDRTKQLESLLAAWIEPGKAETAWRKALAYLKAEGGKLKEAVAALEGVESADELGPQDYQNLANWYLVLGDDARREQAQLTRYQVMDIYQISRRVNQERSRVSRRGNNVPQNLDPDVLRAARVMLSKAPRPRDYVWYVRNLYRSVKDFRLLESLPYGVVGHTAEGIYPFLERVGNIINEVHEEATCDALVAAIRSQTQSADRLVDQRGLLLLTAMVERRAARVLNAPGGHVQKGLAAMRTAFKGTWLPGERALMAHYLYSLGKIRHRQYSQEQLRQLKELYARAEGSAANKLTIAYHLARTYWRYDQKGDAVDTLQMALADYKRANGGMLRSPANATVNTLVGYMENRGHYAAGETFLRKQRADQLLQSQKNWYLQRIYQLYSNCLSKGGSISIGAGEELYLAARNEMRDWLWKCSFDQMNRTLTNLCGLHRSAHKVGLRRSGTDLETWARESMPELTTRFALDQGYRVRTVASTLATVRNHRVALASLLDHIEREPNWLRRLGRDGWNVYGWSIAEYRYKARRIGDLAPRLRKVALRELARDLARMSWRNSSLYYRNNRYFWGAMAGQFADTALETIRANQDSPSRIIFAARYLWNGLRERDEAVDALVALDERSRLPDGGRYQLAVWLQEMRRWKDSIGHLTKLIDKNPDNIDYRVRKIRGLFETGSGDDAKSLIAATEKRFKDKKTWHVNVIASLANVAREGRYYDKGAALYEEAIRMFERASRRRWNYRSTLSGYYTQMARCLTALNRWDAAVDAASAAVVAWGKDQKNRRQALAELKRVFRKMGDGVDDYVTRWDQKVQKTGLDAPVVRKMLGLVYMDSGRWPQAIQQLEIARELQPNDAAVHTNLVKCYDRKGDRAGAGKALLTSIRMSPMNLALYTDLGRRLGQDGDKVGSERAYTTMVEVKPNEAESHRLLAQLREKQRRYPDAVVQWQQVVRVRSKEPDGWLRRPSTTS
jgi:predicted Zn-dependent protease